MKKLTNRQLREIRKTVNHKIYVEVENHEGKQNVFAELDNDGLCLEVNFNVNVKIEEIVRGTYHTQSEYKVTKERIDDALVCIWDEDEYDIPDDLFDLICKNIILE